MTRFGLHVETWKDCTSCDLHKGRTTIALARGSVPCDVLFIGEAPGESENSLCKPFCGPAGHLLDHIVSESVPAGMSVAFTNLVACIPYDETGAKTAEPPSDSIEACAPRLEEFVAICQPRLIVCVGALSEAWIAGTKGVRHLLTSYTGKIIAIKHPAAILRINEAMQGLDIQRCCVKVATAIHELKE